jgi:hypothetical protein
MRFDEFTIRGAPRERGRAHGERLAERIHQTQPCYADIWPFRTAAAPHPTLSPAGEREVRKLFFPRSFVRVRRIPVPKRVARRNTGIVIRLWS